MTSFSIVNKNANRFLWVAGLLVFTLSLAYVVNTLFINPGKNVDFGIIGSFTLPALLGLFVLLVLLSVLNLSVEAIKWQRMTRPIQAVSFRQSMGSVLTGLAVGFVTPNRLGDFPGRAVLFSPGNRTRVVFMNLLSGYAQFVVICILGLVSLCFLPAGITRLMHGSQALHITWLVVILLLLVFHLLVMFNTGSFLAFFARFNRLKKITAKLGEFPNPGVAENIMAIQFSALRSLVYTVQLVLLLSFMDNNVPFIQWVLYTNVYFFVLTVAPSFLLNKLGVRESLAALVFYDICSNPVVPVVSVLLLWIINQVIPALAGACILIKKARV